MDQLFAYLSEVSFAKDIAIPITAALLGLWVATRKYRSEQTWREKYASYQRLLQAIDSIDHWAEEVVSSAHFLPVVGAAKDGEYAQAQREILRQSRIGALLLSVEFLDRLEHFKTEFFGERFDANEQYADDARESEQLAAQHASNIQGIVRRHLPDLIRLARKDLGSSWSPVGAYTSAARSLFECVRP